MDSSVYKSVGNDSSSQYDERRMEEDLIVKGESRLMFKVGVNSSPPAVAYMWPWTGPSFVYTMAWCLFLPLGLSGRRDIVVAYVYLSVRPLTLVLAPPCNAVFGLLISTPNK